MNANEIRSRYLAFFKEHGHTVIPSASLVPDNDPTVLFTTAGMQPLVPYLMGEQHPGGKRLTSSQKCVRTGDIDDIGDNRHLTFFEMLGNWSLGDYFKKESLAFSWEFLTSKNGLALDPQRIYITVFAGDQDAPRDEESIAIWQDIFAKAGISNSVDTPLRDGGRIFPLAKEDNWWGPAGQTGPCGPDSEIFYDINNDGALLSDGMTDFEEGRIVEIWNNVFMQYNKQEDGSFVPLKQNNVDTGMGLERTAMVLQGKSNVFETDLFQPLITALKNNLSPEVQADTKSMAIMADHFRTSIMLITDGVRPSNKDRGYVLRRLIRRAILHSQKEDASWISSVVEAVGSMYAEVYPVIGETKAEIAQVLTEEAAKFQRTIAKGKQEIAKRGKLSGKDAFDLYQSYGFPLELTKEYAAMRGVTIDEEEFENEFKNHQELSRTASAGQFASGLADHSEQTVKYHTATHLLHQALKDVLGDSVQQRGSNLTPERLRFDFAYPEKVTPEQIEKVEAIVNEKIKEGLDVSVVTMNPEEAKASGAIGLFGHKYGDSVTVYSIGNYSKEICTGPHVKNTRDMGVFKVAKEEAVSAGVRRIKAVLE
jgi:alanyl-tRNA synthetase